MFSKVERREVSSNEVVMLAISSAARGRQIRRNRWFRRDGD
jgi:hypothetical protein